MPCAPFKWRQGFTDRLCQDRTHRVKLLHQVDDRLGIGIGFETRFPQPQVLPAAPGSSPLSRCAPPPIRRSADVGMGIAGVGFAVGGPAGVADPDPAVEGHIVHQGFQVAELAGVSPDFDVAVRQYRQAGKS